MKVKIRLNYWIPWTIEQRDKSQQWTAYRNIYIQQWVTIAFLLKGVMSQRGMANGFMVTATSVFKIIGPVGGRCHTAILAWSERRLNASFLRGIAIVVYQLTMYALAQKACGLINLSRIAGALTIPLQQVHPFIAQLVVVTIAFLLKSLMSDTLSSNLSILANGTVKQSQRGIANGFMLTAMSVFKIMGPAGSGAILAWSERRLNASFIPGTHMVFLVLNVVEGLGLLFLFEPFLRLTKNKMNQLQ